MPQELKPFWVIYNIPSNGYLPNADGRRGRGFTHVEPTHLKPPRLFTSKGGAKRSLWWYLRGKTTVSQGLHPKTSPWGDIDEDYSEDWHTEPMPDRLPENYQIWRVTIART